MNYYKISEEEIEIARVAFEKEINKGVEIARNNGINLTRFKIEVLKGLKHENDEDQWIFDYESYLCFISRFKFITPTEWGEDYYIDDWAL